MSDGISDALAEARLYTDVRDALHDVVAQIPTTGGRLRHDPVSSVNTLIADLGWELRFAQYAEPVFGGDPIDCEMLWDAVIRLRKALFHINCGHRGWSPGIDPEVDYLLRGSGYVFVRVARAT